MKKESRVKNSIINSLTGFFGRAINCIIGLVCRTIFIRILSTEYLGIDGLFENILYILNFAELGFGSAIIYNMYKPVANDDKEKIKSLVHLYKKVYFIIGCIVLLLGVCLIPFLDFIIKDAPSVKESITVIYILYLIQTLSTYFYGYKKSILTAYQKDYIINTVNFIFSVLKNIIQVIILVITKNYLLYLVIYILSNILSNIIISNKVDKLYPFLKDKKYKKVSKKEIKEIKTNVKSLIINKIGDIISNGTDNILLSIFSSVHVVGLFANYTTLFKQANGIFWDMLCGLTGSIANVNAKESSEKKESILLQLLFVSSYLYGFLCICLGILCNDFISLWIGKEYILSMDIIIPYLLVIYSDGFAYIVYVYKNTEGLFNYCKFITLIKAFINLILSIILGKLMGIKGIFIATIISKLTTTVWYMPYLIYKKCYNKKPYKFYLKHMYYIIITIITYIICYKIISFINITGLMGLILKSITIVILSNILLVLFIFKTNEFKEIYIKLKNLIKKVK